MGSSQTTIKISWLARAKFTTLLCIPAAVSTSKTSISCSNSLNALIIPACSMTPISAICCTPDDAGITFKPCGPSTTISPNVFSPLITCVKLYSGCKPRSISTLASPISASSKATFFPSLHKETPRLTDRFVFPTPPLPLAIAITLTGLIFVIRLNPVAWSTSSLNIRMACRLTQ